MGAVVSLAGCFVCRCCGCCSIVSSPSHAAKDLLTTHGTCGDITASRLPSMSHHVTTLVSQAVMAPVEPMARAGRDERPALRRDRRAAARRLLPPPPRPQLTHATALTERAAGEWDDLPSPMSQSVLHRLRRHDVQLHPSLSSGHGIVSHRSLEERGASALPDCQGC